RNHQFAETRIEIFARDVRPSLVEMIVNPTELRPPHSSLVIDVGFEGGSPKIEQLRAVPEAEFYDLFNSDSSTKPTRPFLDERWSGVLTEHSPDSSTIVVQKGHIRKTVLYNAQTRWTKGNSRAWREDFKEGSRVIVTGRYDAEGRVVATRIDLRASR